MNYKQRNEMYFFVEVDILLLPNPPFGTWLICPQVPLVECSAMFSIKSSPTWIKEKRRLFYVHFMFFEPI